MGHVIPDGQVAHVLTVDVEEYFQVEGYSKFIPQLEWVKFPGRVEKQTYRLLNLFEQSHAKGTFFVLGWIAKRYPNLVRKIASAGHEIASHGFQHKMITKLSPEGFREDLGDRATREGEREAQCGERGKSAHGSLHARIRTRDPGGSAVAGNSSKSRFG